MTRSVRTRVASGVVRGVDEGSQVAFYGIPFAKPPVGVRRFTPPVPVDPWPGELDASSVGAICPQEHDDLDRLIGVPKMRASEEEFLNVNVWTPEPDEGSRPVIVWVHGGAFVTGSNAWEIYHGPTFARDGLVFVSINYRLHALGFLNLSESFQGADASINLGIQDVILGLEWVRDNIAAFGGDPENVTIFGESAGAGMVSALIGAPRARGLFHRVIPQSGFTVRLLEQEQSLQIARNFLDAAGVEPGDWDALRALDVQRIVDISADTARMLRDVPGSPWLAWNNTRHDGTLPLTGWEEVLRGGTTHLDLLIGTTADENKLAWLLGAPTGEPYPVDRLAPADAEELLRVYREAGRGTEQWELAEAVGNDQSYLIPGIRAAEEHRARGGNVYQYFFSWKSPVLDGRLGSCHALEVPFVFDRLDQPLFLGDAPPQELADAMHGAWVRFAATGNPGGGGLPVWPQYDAESRVSMVFGDSIHTVSDLRAAERRAWDRHDIAVLGVG